MNTFSAHIQYRPIRIGFCIRENNFEDYRKALRLTHTLWGGRYNPIIPIGGGTDLESKLVESFKVDALFPVENDETISNFLKKFPHLPWPLHITENLFIQGRRSLEPAFLDIYQAALRLNSDLLKYNHRDTWQLNCISWTVDDPLSNIFEAMFGTYPSTDEIKIDYDGLIASRLNVNSIAINPQTEISPDLFKHSTRNQLTTHLLFGGEIFSHPGLYVGSVKNFSDLINFWNMRACGMSLLFYDTDYSSRLDNIKNTYLELQRQQPKPNYVPDELGVWATPERIQSLDTQLVGKDLLRCPVVDRTLQDLNKNSSVRYFKGKTALGVFSDSPNGSLSFQLPEKPTISDGIGHFQHLITSIKVFSGSASEDQTFKVPYIPELNVFYGQKMHIWNEVRVEPEGLGLITKIDENNLYLRSLSVKELTQEVFKQYGMTATPSKAGLIASRIIQQFGGLRDCCVFKIKGVRELIEIHKPTQSFTRQGANQVIGQNDPITKLPNFSKYENLYITSRPVGTKLKAPDVFNYLITKNVFRVGLELKYVNCDLEFWRAIDDIKSSTTCEYCGNEFNILGQLKDRDWFFRRSGIFGHDNNQEGGIPVALTLQQLHAKFHFDNFLYTTAMNIEPNGANINSCETDFVIITWNRYGEVSIIISECKTRKPITIQDAENLKKVADAFPENRINTYVLFSKLDNFSDDEISACIHAQGTQRKRVIMLTDRELEPWHIYEQTKNEFEIDEHAVDWSRMASNTIKIFIEKKPKSQSA